MRIELSSVNEMLNLQVTYFFNYSLDGMDPLKKMEIFMQLFEAASISKSCLILSEVAVNKEHR